jgi:cytochrome c peroxidase
MAGNPGENDVAGAAHDRIDAPWPIIAKRVRNINDYGSKFVSSYEHISHYTQVNIVDIANALAAFISTEWKSNDSRYDKFISGNKMILTNSEKSGMNLFFGKAKCNDCHNGKLLSDQKFYSISLPSFGPGRTRIFDPLPRDTGHMAETDDLSDAYRFRTPMLRNIKLSAPYGHNGAYPDLKGIIQHHLNPLKEKGLWKQEYVSLPSIQHLNMNDFIIQEDVREMTRQSSFIDIEPIKLSDAEINDLVLFMGTLTGDTIERIGIPKSVPSGLSID